MAKPTATRDRNGQTFEAFSKQVREMASQEARVQKAYVTTYKCLTNSGKFVIGHFEDHYAWNDGTANYDPPADAVCVYEKQA